MCVGDFPPAVVHRHPPRLSHIAPADVESFAEVRFGYTLGDRICVLVEVFGNLPMTFLVLNDRLERIYRQPNRDIELQGYLNQIDGKLCVRRVNLDTLRTYVRVG